MAHLTVGRESRPLKSLNHIWEHMSLKLREVRSILHQTNERLYGLQERIPYLEAVQDALQTLTARKKQKKVESLTELDKLINKASDDNSSFSRLLDDAADTLTEFRDKCQVALEQLEQIYMELTHNVQSYLDVYCNDYRKLGIPDDRFDESLQSRKAVMDNYLHRYKELAGFVQKGVPVDTDLFGYSFFSQEVAIELDCDAFPVLRLLPDLIQKMEMACDIAADWLRGDKIYVQELEKAVEMLGMKLKDGAKAVEMGKLKYDRLFLQLKEKQHLLNEQEDNVSQVKREIVTLEAKKVRIEEEMRNEDKSKSADKWEVESLSEVSESECENELSVTTGYLHRTYSDRLNLHSRSHSAKLDSLRQQRKAIGESIQEKSRLLAETEDILEVMPVLSKKIRVAGRQKVKMVEEMKWTKGQMDKCVTFLKRKLHPELPDMEKSARSRKEAKKQQKKNQSADMDEAFRIVKDGIGLAWKDLARNLPYSPERDGQDINNEITAIEYENQGQLKEQAYQALVQWSTHNGRRASIDKLQDTLRTLQVNKIADEIEEKVIEARRQESARSRRRHSMPF